MGFIGGRLAAHMLDLTPKLDLMNGSAYATKSKLETLLGSGVWRQIQGKTVLDFGCGHGEDAIAMAQRGASHVVGVDILEEALGKARRAAELAGVADRCTFTTSPPAQADVIVSLDSFEHFADPAAILVTMHRLLAPGVFVLL